MARGRSRGHKGGRKQFSNPDQIKEDLRKVPKHLYTINEFILM